MEHTEIHDPAQEERQKLAREAEQKLFERNFTRFGLDMNPVVSLAAAAFVLLFAGLAMLDLERANAVFAAVQAFIITRFDWVFILSSNFFILVCLLFAFSRLGTVKIGGVDAKPEFSNFAWYSMLISAGMGIGLMFWAVGEPLYHATQTPPIFPSADPNSSAMAATFFHWGVHPWGIYTIIALALAFFAYNKGLPLSLRSVFFPLLGKKVFGIWGDLIDILAILATLFGLATSLGLGVQQINSGLNFLTGMPYSTMIQIALIAGVTGIATISVVSGIEKGVRILSELNMKLAACFLVFMLLVGPTAFIIRLFTNSLGIYVGDLITSSFFIGSGESSAWQGSWSVFYLAWWISWSPFVGMFIARISKGRSIREFVTAVMVIPPLLSFFWMSVFGGNAIYINEQSGGALFAVVQDNLPVALFEMLSRFNLPVLQGAVTIVLSTLATVMVIFFFVTSSDSGSLVINNITSGGKIRTPVGQRIFWAVLEGLVAAVLLLIGGEQALAALQTAVISTGLPFALLLVLMSIMLINSVRVSQERQKRLRDIKMFQQLYKLTHRRHPK
ncbi:BCCT family transporter [Spirochaeta africana]|uniref:Choline/carnitine/betaine transport n=1 Tax=Spirochaeta africana (strain ATCC 700263 / DSM 8902 / Z-7692) TaxID=889378 RepID=H9UHJ5_SPIAZ|nr:BCCT family transporter [Spirochaeta africana]AFG36988.1 choline/carnitine/betaine transport [Spirochaeta africana DSM 8902]